jgi:hypothetical protein
MLKITWIQLQGMANIYVTDSDLERDFKFDAWINQRKYRIITVDDYVQEHENAVYDGTEVLIIKE